jgi:hypothetical protein
VGLALSAVIITVVSDLLKVYLARVSGAVTRTHLINTCPAVGDVLPGSTDLPKRPKNVVGGVGWSVLFTLASYL